MSSLTLLAQQYLPISPRHVSLLTLDSCRPSAVVAASAAFDPEHCVFFLEWDDPSDASSFRVSHVSVPGGGVTSLALTVDAAGTVHCVVHARGAKGRGGSVAHVYRRLSPANGPSGAVHYVRGDSVRDERCCTAAARLSRSDGGAGRLAFAHGGLNGESHSLHLTRLAHGQLSPHRTTLDLPVLSGFPILQLREVDGDAASVLALCHHAVVAVDTRLPRDAAVVRAWRWSPHDPLTAFALRDNAVAAGTEDGVVVLWDVRQRHARDRAVDHSAPGGAPVTGLHMPHRESLLSCHADGAVLAWEQRRETQNEAAEEERGAGFAFVPQRVHALPPVFVGTPGCVGIAAEDGMAVVADESGTLSIFAVL